MRVNKGLIFLYFMTVLINNAVAQGIKDVSREGTVEVRAEIGKAIEVGIPAGVSNLVRSGDAASLKVEHVAGHLFITPLLHSAAELVIIDSNGRSYRLKFVFDQGIDEKVVITAGADEGGDRRTGDSSIEILRALAAGRPLTGAVESAQETVVFQDTSVRIKVLRMYEIPGMIGYELSAENLLAQSLVVPVEQFNFPGLLAVTSKQDILSPAGTPGERGIIYMVTAR